MQVYSNAFNFNSFLAGGVDPRTGLYGCRINLVTFKPEGPSVNARDIALTFSMLNQTSGSYGLGWRISTSQFNPSTQRLLTLSGEVNTISNFPSIGNVLRFRDRKLQDLFVRQVNQNTLHILHKDGVVEVLRPLVVNGVFVIRELIFENGEVFSFSYNNADNLQAIIHQPSGRAVLRLVYTSGLLSSAHILKDGGRSARYEFSYVNGRLSSISLPLASSPPAHPPIVQNIPMFSFQYAIVGSVWAISHLNSPMGVRDHIRYRVQGHPFFNNQFIPNVMSVTTDAPPSQSVTKQYSYSPGRNFTGFPFAVFHPGQDNIYVQVPGYEYFTEERTLLGDAVVESTTYTFNRFHLEISQRTLRARHEVLQVSRYDLNINESLESQPAHMSLPSEVEIIYRTDEGTRSEKTRMTSDNFGNQLSVIESNGAIREYEYYPPAGAVGCPAEPFGLFARFVKEERVIPAGGDAEDARVSGYTYSDIGTVGNTNAFIVLSTSKQGGVSSSYAYMSDSTHVFHGRLNSTETTINGLVTRTDSHYTSSAPDVLTEHKQVIGFDNTRLSTCQSTSVVTGLLLSMQDNDTVTIVYTYDLFGRVLTETVSPDTDNAATRLYRYSFSSGQHRAAVVTTDAMGVRYIRRFDGFNRHISTHLWPSQGEQLLVQKTYDVFGQLVTQTEVDQIDGVERRLLTQYEYDGWGSVRRTIHPDNTVTLNEYDLITRIRRQGMEGSALVRSHYNDFGKVQNAELVAADGSETIKMLSRDFDGLGRCIYEDDVDGNATWFSYDDYDRVVTETFTPADGGLERRTDYTYAAHAIEPLNISISVNHILLGQRSYDGVGRLISESRGSSSLATTFEYVDNMHSPSSTVSPTDEKKDFDFDRQLDAVSQVRIGEQSIATFDHHPQNGWMSLAVNSEFSRQIQKDAFGRIVADSQNFQGQNYNSAYTYSTAGRMTRIESALGDTEVRNYDAFGRLTGARLNGGKTAPSQFDATYDHVGRISTIIATANGHTVSTGISYDAFGRESSRAVTQDGRAFQTIHLRYYQNNKIASRQTVDADDAIVSDEQFRYDGYGRLTTYTCAGLRYPEDQQGRSIRSQQFTYDILNNMTRVVTGFVDAPDDESIRSFSAADPTQLTQLTHTNPPQTMVLTYDAAGNLSSDGVRVYNFNVWNQVVSVVKDSSVVASYGYDATGRQSRLSDASANTATLHYSDEMIIGMRQGNATGRYVRHQETVLARSISDLGTELYVSDTANSINTVVDAQLQLSHVQYAPYGESAIDANSSGSLLERNQTGFNGERFDPLARLYHFGNGRRAYSPELMIFLSPDPLSPFGTGGINAYAYCSGDPINFRDPSGLRATPLWVDWLILGLSALFIIASVIAIPFTGGASLGAMVILGASIASLILGIAGTSLDTVDHLTGSDYSSVSFPLHVASFSFGIIALGTTGARSVLKGVQAGRVLTGTQRAVSGPRSGAGQSSQSFRNVTTLQRVGAGYSEFVQTFFSYRIGTVLTGQWGVLLAMETASLYLDIFVALNSSDNIYDKWKDDELNDPVGDGFTGALEGVLDFRREFREQSQRVRGSAIAEVDRPPK